MASVGEEDNDAVLSDIEADDLVPISTKSPEDLTEGLTGEVRRLVERERQWRRERERIAKSASSVVTPGGLLYG
ncbi:hypothetical protein CsSME_00000384 [Camellia sinensis var. sinensis]